MRPDGTRLRVRLALDSKEYAEDFVYMTHFGVCLAALYRAEYEKRTGMPPSGNIFASGFHTDEKAFRIPLPPDIQRHHDLVRAGRKRDQHVHTPILKHS